MQNIEISTFCIVIKAVFIAKRCMISPYNCIYIHILVHQLLLPNKLHHSDMDWLNNFYLDEDR